MNSNLIQCGSRYFFGKMPNYQSDSNAFVQVIDHPDDDYRFTMSTNLYGRHLFKWVRHTPAELINYALTNPNAPAMQIGKFLVPKFCSEIGFTLSDLRQLEPLLNKLDNEHKYYKLIYNAYMANGDFILTDEQRQAAYEEWQKNEKNGAQPSKTPRT